MIDKDLFDSYTGVLRKPFLRWTGGKNWLVPHLQTIISKLVFNNYHEPFLGGGSVFFSLNTDKKSYLSDYNSDLVNTYNNVKNNPEKIIELLKEFPQNKEFYNLLREEESDNKIKRAARFIYLNKTSFNGIYRVNKNGKYNVPYGKKSFNIDLVSELIYSCSLQLQNSIIKTKDFKDFISKVEKNDLVYLDPPYTITHNNNGFIKYNEKLFSTVDQMRLSLIIKEIIEKGAYYILSNAHHPDVRKIYDKFGDKIITLSRKSSISANAESRDLYKEYVFTNIKQ